MNVSWVSEPRYQREAKSKENQYRRLLNRKYKTLLLFLMLLIYLYYFSWMIFLLESWATVFPSSNLNWNLKWILTFFNGFDRNFLNYRNGIFLFPVLIAIRIFFSHWKINRRFFIKIVFVKFSAPIYIENEDTKQTLLAYASSRILQPSRSKILILFYGFIYQFSSSHVFYFFAEIK